MIVGNLLAVNIAVTIAVLSVTLSLACCVLSSFRSFSVEDALI